MRVEQHESKKLTESLQVLQQVSCETHVFESLFRMSLLPRETWSNVLIQPSSSDSDILPSSSHTAIRDAAFCCRFRA